MVGVSNALEEPKHSGDNLDTINLASGNVVEELKTFGKECE